jgi:hypothetical protein
MDWFFHPYARINVFQYLLSFGISYFFQIILIFTSNDRDFKNPEFSLSILPS